MTAPDSRSFPGREDDSWGKLASELLGINLGASDDLDLSDLEPPPPPVPAAPPPIEEPPQPVATAASHIDLSDMDFEADEPEADELDDDDDLDVDDVEEETDEETDVEVAAEAYETVADDVQTEAIQDAVAAAQPETDDFWDALESWDWESGEAAQAGASETRERPKRGGERRDRGRRPREDAGERGGSRAPRRGAREERPPRRSDERRPAEPAPSRSAEPQPRGEKSLRPAGESPRPPREPKSPTVDEFGAGVIEDFNAKEAEWPETGRRQRVPDDLRRFETEAPSDTGFSEDLIESEELLPEDLDVGDESGFEKTEQADEPSRPRRRRRRRRRRPAGDRDVGRAAGAGEEGVPADLEDDREERPELETSAPFVEELENDEGEAEERREPRGRRRRRRSPEDRPPRNAPVRSAEARLSDSDADEDFDEEEDVEPVVAMTYEDVPTWEEAISYLLKPRGDGGGFRSGPSRRR